MGLGSMGWFVGAAVMLALNTASARVFPVSDDSRNVQQLHERTRFILSLSEEQVRAMAPLSSGGVYFCDCPNCSAGSQDTGKFKWMPDKPRQLQCEGCGEIYPDNPKYPDQLVTEIEAPAGTVHRLAYWQRENGHRFYFRAKTDYFARDYLEQRCRDLADLYYLTGDEIYARRAAVILLRFAEVYPGWVTKFDYDNIQQRFPHLQEKRFAPWHVRQIEGIWPYRTSRWTWWAYMDVPRHLLAAYESLKAWSGLATMADGRAIEMIEHDFFDDLIGFVLGFEDDLSNMSLGMWRDLIHAGRVLERPQWIDHAASEFERLLTTRFLYDGHWMEPTLSYHSQVTSNMQQVMTALEGRGSGAWSGYAVAQRILSDATFPDGRFIPLNDTWAVHRRRAPWQAHRRERTQSFLLPGLGVAVLGGGEAEHQWLAYLNFTAGTQHKQPDALSIGLYAFDRELLSDIGYTHARYRPWAHSTMSHNTVVVNGRESEHDRQYTGQRLRQFAGDGTEFHLASAESTTAYAGVTSRYRRTLATIGADSRDGYVIDLFDVRGGNQHDYLLHGSADQDSHAVVHGAAMSALAGTLMNEGVVWTPTQAERDPRLGKEGAFGFVRDLTVGEASGSLRVEFRVEDDPAVGLISHLAAPPRSHAYLGQSPSLRRANESDAMVDQFWMPSFVLRRKGENLSSLFAAVHEPVRGAGRIGQIAVRREEEAVLVTVDRGRFGTDYFVMALDEPLRVSFDTVHGELTLDGAAGWLRVDADGAVRKSHALGASLLSLGGFRSEGGAGWSGEVLAVHRGDAGDARGWFDVAGILDASPAALIIEFPDGSIRAFNIEKTQPADGGTRLFVREDPGIEFKDAGIVVTHYPQRTIEDQTLRYRLPTLRRHHELPGP